MLTSPKRAKIGRGSRTPSARSSEYLPGPISIRALAIAVFVKGSSAPPLVAQIGFSCNGWTLAVAIAMAPVTPRGPRGLRNPRSISTPPPNSESPAAMAQALPGRNSRDSSQSLVPCKPCPSNQPNNFCDPWPAINQPKVARKISKARLRAPSPLRLFFLLGDAKLLTTSPPSPFSRGLASLLQSVDIPVSTLKNTRLLGIATNGGAHRRTIYAGVRVHHAGSTVMTDAARAVAY